MKYYQTREFAATVKKFQRCLDAAQIRYALIGGHATDVYVNPPVTKDIDISIEYNEDKFDRLRACLRQYKEIDMYNNIDDRDSGFVIYRYFDKKTKGRVDIIMVDHTFTQNAATRSRTIKLSPQLTMAVAQPEDLILLKFDSYITAKEATGQPRRKDIQAVYHLWALPRLNKKYIAEQLKQEGIYQDFQRLVLFPLWRINHHKEES